MGNAAYIAHGLNEANEKYYRDTTGAVTNAADFTTTLPAHARGKGLIPLSASVMTPAGSAVGARTWTAVAVVIKTYVEATGVLTLTAGGTIASGSALTVFMTTGDS